MTHRLCTLVLVGLLLALASACGGVEPGSIGSQQQAFTSPRATLAKMTFDGEVIVDCTKVAQQIQVQVLFTVGALNEDNSVGRIDSLEISEVASQPLGNGTCLATYRAAMPVGWAKYVNYVPQSHTMQLPRDVTFSGRKAFFAAYGSTCKDWTDHADVNNFWYYYRPNGPNCKLAAEDIVEVTAALEVATEDGAGTYPELHKIWEDGELNAIVLFGMYGDGHDPKLDPNATIYGLFNNRLRTIVLGGATLTPDPADVSSVPGVDEPRVTWSASLPDGRRFTIHTMLINSPTAYDPAFDQTFAQLSPKADIIIYNGHSGFGANIRALAQKAQFAKGHYTIVSMMGCDTFAYIDDEMANRVAQLNPDDPKGTKYLDMITNLTPAKPAWLLTAGLELLRGVADPSNPLTYDVIMLGFDTAHLAAVTGDEDNTYVPGTPIGPAPPIEPDWPTDQIGLPAGPARDAGGGCSVSGSGAALPLWVPLLLIGLLVGRRACRRT